MVYAKKVAVPIVFFVAVGLFFLSKPETSFAGAPPVLGCCINANPSGQQFNCVGCSRGPCQVPENNCGGPNNVFTPNEECFDPAVGQGAAFCSPVVVETGCCEFPDAPTDCDDGVTGSACAEGNGAFFPGGQCVTETSCTPGPEPGCCQIESNQCTTEIEENCQAEFFPGVPCTESGVCEPPPPPPQIPTLNQWGTFIMAGFLGLIGIFFARRRFGLRRSS